MKYISLILLQAFICLAASAIAGQGKAEPFVKDEVLVKVRSARAEAARLFDAAGLAAIETLGDSKWLRLKITNGETVAQAIERLSKSVEVEAAQPNFYYHLLATPNDPLYTSAGMYGLPKISAPQAWDLTTGSSAVVVADIDTGLRYSHQDLAANTWTNSGEIAANGVDDDNNGFIDDVYGWDFRYNDSDPWDQHGHGTHTAGTIGAIGNNLLGVVGVNWTVKVMAIKIYSPSGTDTTSAMLVNAYNYVRLMKQRGVNIRVTNNSYGGCLEACGYDQATKDALDAMGDAGILNVFAAGNAGVNNDSTASPSYPAQYTSPSVLAVAASTSTDARASFSSYGTVSTDLAAPGASILSTHHTSDTATTTMSGTSMATPHVAGAAALLSAYNPNLSAASLKATIMNTVDVITTPTNWSQFVKTGGRLNAFAALQNQTVCNFTPSATSITARTKGGYYSVNVSAAANCDYFAKSAVNWIKVEGSDVRSGTALITFRVLLNPGISRTGTLNIGGQTVTVTQSRS